MEEEDERKELIKILEEELKKDRSKTQVMGFTKLDLLEMTRKRNSALSKSIAKVFIFHKYLI